MDNKTRLYILRGLPGSGKSTFAKKMIDKKMADVHFEADMFFVDRNGQYRFDPSKLGSAHRWCENNVKRALESGKNVVVSNTFTTLKEMKPYIDYCRENGYPFMVVRLNTQYKSIHAVPEKSIMKMKTRFQDYPGETKIIG